MNVMCLTTERLILITASALGFTEKMTQYPSKKNLCCISPIIYVSSPYLIEAIEYATDDNY